VRHVRVDDSAQRPPSRNTARAGGVEDRALSRVGRRRPLPRSIPRRPLRRAASRGRGPRARRDRPLPRARRRAGARRVRAGTISAMTATPPPRTTHPYYMHDAIHAQPGALRTVTRSNAEALASAAERLRALDLV